MAERGAVKRVPAVVALVWVALAVMWAVLLGLGLYYLALWIAALVRAL